MNYLSKIRRPIGLSLGLSMLYALIAAPLALADSFVRASGDKILGRNGQVLTINGINTSPHLWQGWILGGGVSNSETTIYQNLVSLVGPTQADAFRSKLDNQWISDADINRMKQLGFNTIRLSINHTVFESNSRISSIDKIIDMADARDMYVILTMTSAPYPQNTVSVIADYNPGQATLWAPATFEQAKAQTRQLWRDIAARYKDEKAVLGYDLLNEPDGTVSGFQWWNSNLLPNVYEAVIAGIREVDRNHMIILEGDNYAEDFSALNRSFDDNVAYEFHMYEWTLRKPNYEAAIDEWIAAAKEQQVPIFCGEYGVDNYEEIQKQVDALESRASDLSGTMLWVWKSADLTEGISLINGTPNYLTNHSIREVQMTPAWQKTINWLSANWFASQPSQAEALQGIAEFEQNYSFASTRENTRLASIIRSQW